MIAPSLQLAISVLTPLLSALGAGLLVHRLTRRRDRESARRQQRIGYLLAAYRKLEAAAHRDLTDGGHRLEEAYSEILLFGNTTQIELAQRFAREFTANGSARLDELLLALRRDLRLELGLDDVPLDAVSALRVDSLTPTSNALTHFDSAWTSNQQKVAHSLPPVAPQAIQVDLRESELAVDRAPGAAVMSGYREVGHALRNILGEGDDINTADPLDLARVAHTRGLISDGSLTAVEGLGIMADLTHAKGSGTGLSPDRARDYLVLASATIFAIQAEARDSGKD